MLINLIESGSIKIAFNLIWNLSAVIKKEHFQDLEKITNNPLTCPEKYRCGSPGTIARQEVFMQMNSYGSFTQAAEQ